MVYVLECRLSAACHPSNGKGGVPTLENKVYINIDRIYMSMFVWL